MHSRTRLPRCVLGLELQSLQRTLQESTSACDAARLSGGGDPRCAPLVCAFEPFTVNPTTRVVDASAVLHNCSVPLAVLVVGGLPKLLEHRRHWTVDGCEGAPPDAAPVEGANNEHEVFMYQTASKVAFSFRCCAERFEQTSLAAEGDVCDAPDASSMRAAMLSRLVPRVVDVVNRILARSGRQPVGASDLLVADASDPYDEHAFWTLGTQRLVYQMVMPSLYLAHGADRRALLAELRRDEMLGPLVDCAAYEPPVGLVLFLGAQRIGGQPLLPVTSVPDGRGGTLRFGGDAADAVDDFRLLTPDAVARHAWTLVDLNVSMRLFDDDGGAAGGAAEGAGGLSTEARRMLRVFDAWCRERGMACDASHFDVVESVGAASLTLTPAAARRSEGEAPPCACPARMAHGGASLHVWLEDGRHVMVQCCAAVPEGDAGELRLCSGRGVPKDATTSVALRGGEHSQPAGARTCSVAYAGPLPETLFRVPVDLELPAVVDRDGRLRLGPLTDQTWRDAMRALRASGRIARGQVRTLILRQAMGSGKSYQANLYLVELARRARLMNLPRPRFVWLCPKVSLVARAFADLDAAMPGFWKTYDDPSAAASITASAAARAPLTASRASQSRKQRPMRQCWPSSDRLVHALSQPREHGKCVRATFAAASDAVKADSAAATRCSRDGELHRRAASSAAATAASTAAAWASAASAGPRAAVARAAAAAATSPAATTASEPSPCALCGSSSNGGGSAISTCTAAGSARPSPPALASGCGGSSSPASSSQRAALAGGSSAGGADDARLRLSSSGSASTAASGCDAGGEGGIGAAITSSASPARGCTTPASAPSAAAGINAAVPPASASSGCVAVERSTSCRPKSSGGGASSGCSASGSRADSRRCGSSPARCTIATARSIMRSSRASAAAARASAAMRAARSAPSAPSCAAAAACCSHSALTSAPG